ncbi:MAG: hypothetical protein AVO38_04595 [delta proteobacterium ML8_D]|nr:MAG: hypothetical protein AVO38_04595 [delta proteobacterium ML8_D]
MRLSDTALFSRHTDRWLALSAPFSRSPAACSRLSSPSWFPSDHISINAFFSVNPCDIDLILRYFDT